jgi:hypothetical protein
MGSNTAEAQAAVDDMIDLGYVQDANEGLAYCPNGHSFECSRGACPRCGSEPGEPPSTNELVSVDDEISRSEERTSSEEDADSESLLADESSVLEQIESALNDCGCPDAQDVAMKLAPLWHKGSPLDSEGLQQLAATQEWSLDMVRCIELAFERLAREQKKTTLRRPDSQSTSAIRIWRDGKELRWAILNPLEGLAPTGRSGSVTLGRVVFSDSARAMKQVAERGSQLEALARILTVRRKDFFDAKDPTEAKLTLKKPLTQKEICDEIHISQSTMSYWCDYKGRKKRQTKTGKLNTPLTMSTRVGIEVETPHGVLPLAKFITKPSRLKGGENRSQEEVEETLEDVLGDLENQGLNSDEIIQAVLEEYGYDLAKRTMRNYRRRAAEKKEKPSSP